MASFPHPSNTLGAPVAQISSSEKVSSGITKVVFEANYLKVIRQATRVKFEFTLEYAILTLVEYSILEGFFLENAGSPFTFIHPVSHIEYQVVFTQGSLPKKYININIVATSITLGVI